jgi:hypothetical protein
MKRSEQIRIVRELTKSLLLHITVKIELGAIPEEWDGVELRALVAHKTQEWNCHMLPKRKNNFRNTILVNNL